MDIKTLLPHIITAVVSLVSIIATSVVSITLSKSNHKRELARTEYDYRLKQIDSAMQVKMDCYREACKVVSKAKDLVYEVSREAHNEDNKSAAFYLSTKKKLNDKLDSIWNMFEEQKYDAYLVSSWLCDYFFSHFHVTLNRIILATRKDHDPIAFFESEESTTLLHALQNIEHYFYEQVRKELNFSENDNSEIISIRNQNNESGGCLIKKTNGEIVLLAGATAKAIPPDKQFDFWIDEFGYVLSKNLTFQSIEDAATYLMGDAEYDTEQICKL